MLLLILYVVRPHFPCPQYSLFCFKIPNPTVPWLRLKTKDRFSLAQWTKQSLPETEPAAHFNILHNLKGLSINWSIFLVTWGWEFFPTPFSSVTLPTIPTPGWLAGPFDCLHLFVSLMLGVRWFYQKKAVLFTPKKPLSATAGNNKNVTF